MKKNRQEVSLNHNNARSCFKIWPDNGVSSCGKRFYQKSISMLSFFTGWVETESPHLAHLTFFNSESLVEVWGLERWLTLLTSDLQPPHIPSSTDCRQEAPTPINILPTVQQQPYYHRNPPALLDFSCTFWLKTQFIHSLSTWLSKKKSRTCKTLVVNWQKKKKNPPKRQRRVGIWTFYTNWLNPEVVNQVCLYIAHSIKRFKVNLKPRRKFSRPN